MIKLSDAIFLAVVKLRSRKSEALLVVVATSLLFSVLVAGSIIIHGALNSVLDFQKGGLSNRYIVNVNNALVQSASGSVLRDKDLIREAKVRYADLVDKKIARAADLGLSYSQVGDQLPYTLNPDGTELLNPTDSNGIVHALLSEKYGHKSSIDDAELSEVARRYNAMQQFNVKNFSIKNGSSLSVLPSSGEVFYNTSDRGETNAHYTSPIIDSAFSVAPDEITAPFMIPGNSGWSASDGSLPIILPQDIAERLVGFDKLPAGASPAQKIERTRQIRSRVDDVTFKACYRNSASLDLIQKTVAQSTPESIQNVDLKLTYKLPNPTQCANPTIVADTRSSGEKLRDDNQKKFDREFNHYDDPVSYFIAFKVVGISPSNTESSGQDQNVSDILNKLLSSSGVGQLIPSGLYEKISDKSKYQDILQYQPYYLTGSEDNKTRYVEFANAQDAQKFIEEQSCSIQYDGTCKPLGRSYVAKLSFNNSIALSDVRGKLSQLFGISITIVILLAAAITWMTTARTIADSRHETSIFRAIGFKRIDISLIYTIHTILLSLAIVLVAGCLGLLISFFIDKMFAEQITAQALYVFGLNDLEKEFHLLGFNQWQLIGILLACPLAGLLGMVVPLLRNVRRNPIEDLRGE